MTVQSLPTPMPTFNGLDGLPLSGGYVYFGEANKDPREYPVDVFYDAAMAVPVSQPLRTQAGFLYRNGSPTNVWLADGYHSMMVLDSRGRQVFYAPSWIGAKDTTMRATTVDRFSGTGAQTAFTLSVTPASEDETSVFVAGVYIQKNAYSLSGAILTFAVAPASGTNNIEVNTATSIDYSAVSADITESLAVAAASAALAATYSTRNKRLFTHAYLMGVNRG